MNNLTVLDNPIVKRDITILRNKLTTEEGFRTALARIAFALSIEITKTFDMKTIKVETPLETTDGYELSKQIVIVPILRAGLSMVEPFLKMMPNAKVGHIGLQRDEETLQPVDYYFKAPKALDKSKTIVVDPMLATGGSASAAFTYLKEKGANDLVFASIIAAPEGYEKMKIDHPDVPVFTASLDRELNEKGYIVPGLGDAGDRNYGTF